MLTIRKKPINYFDNFDLLFDNIFNESLRSSGNINYHYQETDNAILIEMALPGINKKNIDLSYSDGFLKIKHAPKKTDNLKWSREFFEKIRIIKDIDEKKISARFESGVMYINIPKKIKVVKESKIEIK